MNTARASARWSKPVQIVVGVASTLIGLALFFAPLTVQQIALITGIGIVIAGIVLLLRSDEDPVPRWATRLVAALLLLMGLQMAVWPDAGAPWLAALVGLALIVHGVFTGVTAIRGDADLRVAGVLIALAGIVVGVLVFTWPVLTLSIFRLAVGAWFVFSGVRMIVALLRRQRADVLEAAEPTKATERAEATNTRHATEPRTRSRFATWTRTIAASLALLLAVGAALGTSQLFGGTPLPVPGPFYTAPDEVPAEPGKLIRWEPLTTGVPDGAQAWRMLYTTTDAEGNPAVSSGTILAPLDVDASQQLPLLTVSHGTTGVIDGCSPSLSPTPFADGAGTAMAEMVTEHGWVAVTSDYIGLGTGGVHPYLIGEAEARNVLDASLAVQEFDQLTTTTDTVVWGHSQGGQGSLWTGQIAEQYAPELSVLGVAAFAPAADLYGLADADKNSVGGKVVSAYIAKTWNELYPDLRLEQHLTPGSAGPVERISQLCFNGQDVISAIVRGTQVPNQIFPDSLLAGDFGDKLKAQTPVGPFPAPVLVAQGLADPLVLPPLQDEWVAERCAAGVPIDYRTFEGLSHVSLVAADSPLTPQIVEWTLDRWNGAAAPASCTAHEYPQASS